MARTVLTDELWTQLQNTMKQHGCYITPNTRTIMEAILWKFKNRRTLAGYTRRTGFMENSL